MSLEDVKTLIGRDDKKITIIYNQAEQRLLSRLKRSIDDVQEIPTELEFVVDEVAIARFNRLGSEGMATESMDGHSATYNDLLAPFEKDIQDYINKYTGAGRGRARFI